MKIQTLYIKLDRLPYRMVFAIITDNSVVIHDTQFTSPIAYISNVHYHTLSDISWLVSIPMSGIFLVILCCLDQCILEINKLINWKKNSEQNYAKRKKATLIINSVAFIMLKHLNQVQGRFAIGRLLHWRILHCNQLWEGRAWWTLWVPGAHDCWALRENWRCRDKGWPYYGRGHCQWSGSQSAGISGWLFFFFFLFLSSTKWCNRE